MNELPWLLAHGEWVWRIALVLFVATAMLWAGVWTRRRALRRRRKLLGELEPVGHPDASREGETAVMRGVLEAEDPIERFEDGARVAASSCVFGDGTGQHLASSRARFLAIRTEAGPVVIEGAAQVVLGTEEREPGRRLGRLPTGVRARLLEVADARDAGFLDRIVPRFASVREGDRVVARGALRVGAKAEGGAYRESARALCLRDASLFGESRARLRRPLALRMLSGAVAGAVIFAAVAWVIGHLLDGASEDVVVAPEDGSLAAIFDAHSSTQWLAATPFHGDPVESRLFEALVRDGEPSREVFEAMIALDERAEVRGLLRSELPRFAGHEDVELSALAAFSDHFRTCREAIEAMLAAGHYERVVDFFGLCDAPGAERIAGQAVVERGARELEQGARELERATLARAGELMYGQFEHLPGARDRKRVIRLFLLAGELERAANAADRSAAFAAREGGDAARRAIGTEASDPGGEDDETAEEGFRCLAHALRARAGDAAAGRALKSKAEASGRHDCLLLAADRAAGEARLEVLEALSKDELDPDRDGFGLVADLLRAEIDPAEHLDDLAERATIRRAMPHLYPSNLHSRFEVEAGGLESSLFEALWGREELDDDARRVKAYLALRAAADASVLLRHDRARELLAVAREHAPPGDDTRGWLAIFAAHLALREGKLSEAVARLDPLLPEPTENWLETGGRISVPHRDYATHLHRIAKLVAGIHSGSLPEGYRRWNISRSAMSAGLRGEREAFEEELPSTRSLVRLELFAHWLPEPSLAAHLRDGRAPRAFQRWSRSYVPGELLSRAAIADAIGEEDLAAELKARARALYEASLRREVAVPLVVLDAL